MNLCLAQKNVSHKKRVLLVNPILQVGYIPVYHCVTVCGNIMFLTSSTQMYT